MSTTNTYSGNTDLSSQLVCAFSGDENGAKRTKFEVAPTWSAAGGADPQLSGWLVGTVSITGATDLLLAAAVAAFGEYSPGLVASGLKIREIVIQNQDASHSVTITRKAANGLTLFGDASHGQIIDAGGVFYWYDPTGAALGAVVTGTNDGITITPASGTVTLFIRIAYGP